MQYHAQTIQNVRQMCANLGGVPCAIMLDTKGPEIRSGKLVDGKEILVEQGKTLTLKYFPDDPQGMKNKGCSEWIAQVTRLTLWMHGMIAVSIMWAHG